MKSATIPPKQGASSPGGSSAPSVQRDITTAEAVARHKAQAVASTSASSASTTPKHARATFLRSFVYAWDGVRYVVRTQRNMRVHLALGVLAIALGIGLRISPVEWAVIFVAIALVLVSEMMNTVVEAVVDLASPRFSPLAKVAKDAAAGAVLLNALLSLVIALFVYVPHLWPVLLRLLGR
jgi:diacylglycerol kinase